MHPDFAGALPEPEPKPEPEPQLEPPPPPVVVEQRTPTASPPPPRAPLRLRALQLGLGAGVDFASSSLTPAGAVVVDYGFVDSGFGLVALAAISGARSQPLGPGSVSWRRWPLQLGPRYRVRLGQWALDVSGGPLVGWVNLAGSGFDDNATDANATNAM